MSTSITRARTGCWTCRSRKVKCDEKRPICNRCACRKLSCQYGVRLIWHEESLSRGVCHGRAGLSSTKQVRGHAPAQQQSRHTHSLPENAEDERTSPEDRRKNRTRAKSMFLNTTVRDLEIYFQFEHPEDHQRYGGGVYQTNLTEETPSMGIKLCPHLELAESPAVFQTFDYDRPLLTYFESVICSSSTLLDDAHNNPYRHVILPMAMTSKGLYHATLAVSAQTLRLIEPKYRVAALEHGQRAMRRMIQILNEEMTTETNMDELVALSLMLCWFEITDGSRPSWVTHLNGIWAIIAKRLSSPKYTAFRSDTLFGFFHRYFAFHFVLARTAFYLNNEGYLGRGDGIHHVEERPRYLVKTGLDAEPLPQSQKLCDSSNFLSLNMSLDQLDEIDPYMGFSNSLLLLINESADLAWQRVPGMNFKDLESVRIRMLQIKRAIENLEQIAPVNVGLTSNEEHMARCIDIAEVYRLGSLLFLHHICTERFPHIISNWASVSEMRDKGCLMDPVEIKRKYVKEILSRMLQGSHEMMRTAACPLWPLFLAGCCADEEGDRVTVLGIFQKSEGLRRFGNVRPAREVVEMVWRQHDLGVQDDRKRRRSALDAHSASGHREKLCLDRTIGPSSTSANLTDTLVWGRAMDLLGGWRLSLT